MSKLDHGPNVGSVGTTSGTQVPSAPAPPNNWIDDCGIGLAILVASGLWCVRRKTGAHAPQLAWLHDALNVITIEIFGFLTLATFMPVRPWLSHAIAGASQLLPLVFIYRGGLIVRQMIRSTKA